MKKSLIALAFGTLGLGIAEFVMMGILPDVAKDLGVSIPVAGHFISAYALGVCVGAPTLILARKHPLKHILLALVTLIMLGNICAAMAPNYWVLLLARFISGLPHGAYFGVASIVAEKLADKGKGSEAVSIMIAGMTIANLFGVPLGTSLSNAISWRVTFLLVGCIIETKVAYASIALGYSEIQTNSLGMSDVQVSIRFRREASLYSSSVLAFF